MAGNQTVSTALVARRVIREFLEPESVKTPLAKIVKALILEFCHKRKRVIAKAGVYRGRHPEDPLIAPRFRPGSAAHPHLSWAVQDHSHLQLTRDNWGVSMALPCTDRKSSAISTQTDPRVGYLRYHTGFLQ